MLGNAHADLGSVDRAEEAYRRALALDPLDSWTMNNLGLLMIRDGRHEEALPPLARATELRPDVAVFQNNLGIALERSGHVVEAAEAYGAALAVDPEYEKARVSLERVERVDAPSVSGTPARPFDRAGLASDFAEDVQRWREENLAAEEGEPEERVDSPEPIETEEGVDSGTSVEPEDGVDTGDSIETEEPEGPVRAPGLDG